MPLLKASKKALRTSRRAQERNALQLRQLKEVLKDADEKSINKTYSAIDKAAKCGIIHKNKAARLKAKLSKKIGSIPRKIETNSKKLHAKTR